MGKRRSRTKAKARKARAAWSLRARARHKPGRKPWQRRKRWGLRRRLSMAFTFVALVAVGLTTFSILDAVAQHQDQLFIGGSDEAASHLAMRQIAQTGFRAAFISFILASITAALITRALTRPLGALTRGALRLAEGERAVRIVVPKSRDELRTVSEAFNMLAAGLERQETWRRNMVADIAHDLRTPLSVMRSELEAMQDGVVPLDHSALARLHGEVLILSELVRDLRELSLVESGGVRLEPERVQLASFLGRFCQSFQRKAADAGVKIVLEPVANTLRASFDPEQISRVLGNLLDNALHYAAPGTVRVAALRESGRLKLTVHDSGPGIPEDSERLFERFYQGEASRSRTRSGEKSSGLGLSIARAIVEAHGGTLSATNHPQGGAVFAITLPLT